MNHMDKVWKMLGLDIFEKFNITDTHHSALQEKLDGKIRNPYYFHDEGLMDRDGTPDNHKLAGLITGYYTIEKVPGKKPEPEKEPECTGKLKRILEKEKHLLRHSWQEELDTEIKKALQGAGFDTAENPHCAGRTFCTEKGTLHADVMLFGAHDGMLCTYRNAPLERGNGTYGIPRKIMEADDAGAFMDWLDKTLEPWL